MKKITTKCLIPLFPICGRCACAQSFPCQYKSGGGRMGASAPTRIHRGCLLRPFHIVNYWPSCFASAIILPAFLSASCPLSPLLFPVCCRARLHWQLLVSCFLPRAAQWSPRRRTHTILAPRVFIDAIAWLKFMARGDDLWAVCVAEWQTHYTRHALTRLWLINKLLLHFERV